MRPRKQRTLPAAGLVLALILCGAAPSAADWLVTQRGERIETKGPWEVRGRQVIFTLPNGTLSALRLSEIDLDASVLATSAAKEPEQGATRHEEVEAAPQKEPVLVLTDRDVGRVWVPSARPTETTGSTAPASEEEPVGVVVDRWSEVPDPQGNGMSIVGSLRNQSEHYATDISLSVILLDEGGNEIATSGARLRSTRLGPGRETNFRADFSRLYTVAEVRFEPRSRAFRTRQKTGGESSAPEGQG